MIITYEAQFREVCSNEYWTLFSRTGVRDSAIVYALEKLARESQNLNFEEIYAALKNRYRNRTERSRCSIMKDDKNIEITTRGVIPRFYISLKLGEKIELKSGEFYWIRKDSSSDWEVALFKGGFWYFINGSQRPEWYVLEHSPHPVQKPVQR